MTGKGYSEWSIVGEPVNVAKRLQENSKIYGTHFVCGAFGMSLNASSLYLLNNNKMNIILSHIAGIASRFSHKMMNDKQLKGVGRVTWAYLFSIGPRNMTQLLAQE